MCSPVEVPQLRTSAGSKSKPSKQAFFLTLQTETVPLECQITCNHIPNHILRSHSCENFKCKFTSQLKPATKPSLEMFCASYKVFLLCCLNACKISHDVSSNLIQPNIYHDRLPTCYHDSFYIGDPLTRSLPRKIRI
jgi:hypothetical protein